MWMQSREEGVRKIRYIVVQEKKYPEDKSRKTLAVNCDLSESKNKSTEEINHDLGITAYACELKKRIFYNNFNVWSRDDEELLDNLETFARKNRDCHGAVSQYEEAIIGVCGGEFRREHIYYKEVKKKKERYARFLEIFQISPEDSIYGKLKLLNGLAYSHVIIHRDGTFKTPQEALITYQELFDEMKSLGPDEICIGYLNILYGISRDSTVYSNEDATSLYRHFEDLLFEIMHRMCTQTGELEFGLKHLQKIARFLSDCYFEPVLKSCEKFRDDRMERFHILCFLGHFVDRLYEEFTFVIEGSYESPIYLGERIRFYEVCYFKNYMSQEEQNSCRPNYKRILLAKYLYDSHSTGEKYSRLNLKK